MRVWSVSDQAETYPLLLQQLGYHCVFFAVLAYPADPAHGLRNVLDWHLILDRDGQATAASALSPLTPHHADQISKQEDLL